MKNVVIVPVAVLAVILFSVIFAACAPLDGAPVIGPGGGAVFYDKKNYSDGWRYLECAPNDAGELTNTGKDINFEAAARMAAGYSNGGVSGWRLPTDTEFKKLFKNMNIYGTTNIWYMELEFKEKIYYLTESSVYHGKEVKSYNKEGKETTNIDLEKGSNQYQSDCSYKVRPVRRF